MADVRETAGRVIFAAGDHDVKALLAALRPLPREQNLALVLALAETAVMALEESHGDGWREALNMAMLAASVEEVSRGAAEDR